MRNLLTLAATGVVALGVGLIAGTPAFAATATPAPTITNVGPVQTKGTPPAQTVPVTLSDTVVGGGYGAYLQVYEDVAGTWTLAGVYFANKSTQSFNVPYKKGATAVKANEVVYDGYLASPYSNVMAIPGLPTGQAPEVPWAAGLPLVAGAAGVAIVWRRHAQA